MTQSIDILRRKTEDLEVKKYAVDCLEEVSKCTKSISIFD